jgi:hypothetical protein
MDLRLRARRGVADRATPRPHGTVHWPDFFSPPRFAAARRATRGPVLAGPRTKERVADLRRRHKRATR